MPTTGASGKGQTSKSGRSSGIMPVVNREATRPRRHRTTLYLRWGQVVMWVVATVLLFGPVNSAIPGGSPPGAESPFEDVVSLLIAVTGLTALGAPGWAAMLGVLTSLCGLVIGGLDLFRGWAVGYGELAIFGMLALLSCLLGASWRSLHRAGSRRARPTFGTFTPLPSRDQRVRRLARILVGCGTAVAIGGLIWIDLAETTSENLSSSAVSTPGTILAAKDGAGVSAGSVVVSYKFNGQIYRETVYLDDSSPAYSIGESVTVQVDRSNPAHATVDNSDNIPTGPLTLMILMLVGGFAALIAGLAMLFTLRKHRYPIRTAIALQRQRHGQ